MGGIKNEHDFYVRLANSLDISKLAEDYEAIYVLIGKRYKRVEKTC
jgi:hypothetical protein